MKDTADLSQQSSASGGESGQDDPDERILDGAGQALFRLGRVFSRYPIHQLLEEETGRAVQISHILVAQAVIEAQSEPGREATIGTVAEKLAIDPSTASRLVAETIQAGYLTRSPSAADGRRIQLNLTRAGHELNEHARHYQRHVFEQVTQDWPDEVRLEFARLFIQFAQTVTEAYPGGK